MQGGFERTQSRITMGVHDGPGTRRRRLLLVALAVGICALGCASVRSAPRMELPLQYQGTWSSMSQSCGNGDVIQVSTDRLLHAIEMGPPIAFTVLRTGAEGATLQVTPRREFMLLAVDGELMGQPVLRVETCEGLLPSQQLTSCSKCWYVRTYLEPTEREAMFGPGAEAGSKR